MGSGQIGVLTSRIGLTYPVPDNSTRVSAPPAERSSFANLSSPLLNSSTTDGDRPAPTTSAQDALMDSLGRFHLTLLSSSHYDPAHSFPSDVSSLVVKIWISLINREPSRHSVQCSPSFWNRNVTSGNGYPHLFVPPATRFRHCVDRLLARRSFMVTTRVEGMTRS